jgi:hypothetical protein
VSAEWPVKVKRIRSKMADDKAKLFKDALGVLVPHPRKGVRENVMFLPDAIRSHERHLNCRAHRAGPPQLPRAPSRAT